MTIINFILIISFENNILKYMEIFLFIFYFYKSQRRVVEFVHVPLVGPTCMRSWSWMVFFLLLLFSLHKYFSHFNKPFN